MALLRSLALGIVLFAATGKAQVEFSYENNGADRWVEEFPKCGGQRQSPVNIQLNRTRKTSSQPVWLDFPAAIPWEANVTNNGHTALVELQSALPITLQGGPLRGAYCFQQLHFHWGSNDSIGSEHAINSHFSAMEMHMVFYKWDYGSPSRASNHSDGFAVMTVLLDLNRNDNEVLAPIVEALERVPNSGDSTRLDSRIALEALLPINRGLYYTYQGSLTTPPCDEAVTWIIFYQHLPISSRQVALFRTLRTDEDSPLTSNRRPLQPLGDRTVSLAHFGFPFGKRHQSAAAKKGQLGKNRQ